METDTMEEFGPKLPTDDAARKALPIFTFLTEYFPDVIIELTELCVTGNMQHNPELNPADIKWAREKSTDQMNTAFRHMFDRGTSTHYDKDGRPHLIKAIWRLCAQRQLDKEAERSRAVPSRGLGAEAAALLETIFPEAKPIEEEHDPRCPYIFGGRWRCVWEVGHKNGHYSPCGDFAPKMDTTIVVFCSDCGADLSEGRHAASCLRSVPNDQVHS